MGVQVTLKLIDDSTLDLPNAIFDRDKELLQDSIIANPDKFRNTLSGYFKKLGCLVGSCGNTTLVHNLGSDRLRLYSLVYAGDAEIEVLHFSIICRMELLKRGEYYDLGSELEIDLFEILEL